MPASVILVEAQPAIVATGGAVTVRLAGGGGTKPYDYSGQNDWRAGIAALPTMIASLEYRGGEFPQGSVPSAVAIDWQGSSRALLATLASYLWTDAAITVRYGPEGALPPVLISGKVLDAKAENGRLTIALADPAASLKKPLLTARFAGTGGLEGPIEWDGLIRKRIWGRVWNLAGEPIDKANNIYCFADPLRPIQAFDAVRDKGANAAALTTLAWQGSAAATFTALQAASAPAGGGVVCPSIACVKWWTQPAGDLCADLRGEVGAGYVETTASIAERLVAALGGPAFAAGTVAAANAARTAPVGWLADDDSTTVAAMLDELLGNVSLLWLLDDAGAIVIREWTWGAPVAAALSEDVSRREVLRPLATRRLGYKRNETQMARGDLAAIVLAGDVNYADGTPIEALKPAQIAADKTSTNTAAAIAGQGDLATTNQAALPFGTNLLVNSEMTLVDPTYYSGLYPVGHQPGWPGNSTNLGTITFNDRRVALKDGSYGFARDLTGAPNGTAVDCFNSYPAGLALGRFAVPVLPGERLAASARIGHQNCVNGYVVIGFYDENGNYVDEYGGTNVAANIGTSAYNTLMRDSLALTTLAVTVPADGTGSGTGKRRWAVIWVRFNITGSPTNPRLLVSAPLLAKVPANQTAIPAYSPGPTDRQASYGAVTGTNLVSPTYGNLSDSGIYTPIGTAAGIASQGPLATAPSAAPYTNANVSIAANGALSGGGGGQVTIGGLGYTGALNATFGGTLGTNIYSSGGAVQSDAAVITSLGTASAISGQSPWATYNTLTPTQLTTASPNLVYNPSAVLGVQGWTQETGAGVGSVFGSYGEGNYWSNASATQASAPQYYQDIPCVAGTALSISAKLFAGGLTRLTGSVAQVRVYVQWINPAKTTSLGFSNTAVASAGSGWTYAKAENQVAPTGTGYARVRFDIWGDGTWSNTNAAWKQIKVELGTVATPYSDEATYGALYQTGQNIDALKPAEVNANVTETRTASAIAGQAWAATNGAQSAVDNNFVSLGQNAIVNSGFDNSTTGFSPGWHNYTSFTPAWGHNLSGWSGALNVAFAMVPGTPPAGVFDSHTPWGSNLADLRRWCLPVADGDRVFASALVAYHRNASAPELKVGWYNAAGSYLTETTVAYGGRNGGAGSGDPSNFDRVGGFVTAPTNARFARVWIRGSTNGSQNDPYLFYTQFMLCRVPSSQTAWPVYQPGPPERYANVTEERTASAIVGQGAGATANNLAQLDATAAAQLTTAYNGGVQTAGFGETLKRRIGASGSISLSAQVSVNAGGSTSGNIKARIEVSLFGANSWSTVATGSGASVTPSEPGIDEVTSTYTNSTGSEQLFEFRVAIVRTPSTAGGATINSQSYVTG